MSDNNYAKIATAINSSSASLFGEADAAPADVKIESKPVDLG